MAIRFSNGFGVGASNNGGGGSLSFFTDISGIATYLSGYMSDFRNPDFYEYDLDGNDGHYIHDGGGDMYDDGNATSPWLISNATYTGNSAYNSIQDYPYSVDYSNNGVGTVNTSFGYVSLGYNYPNSLPLTVIGTRATIASAGTPIGFQNGGNIGADGAGSIAQGTIYTGDIVSGFTVHAYYREIYDAGDPSVCDVFILLGHPDWNSVFGDVHYGAADVTDGSCGSFLYTTGNGAQNILAIKTLLSKNGGTEVTYSEVNTVVDNFIIRVKEAKESLSVTPTPTPTPTPSPAPLTQYTPNGTNGPNGLITWLDYTTGINASNHLIDQSPFNNEFSYTGANPYNSGVTGYTFTGTGSYASALSVTQYNQIVNSFTIEMWVKIPSIPSTMSLLAAGGNSSGGWALRVDGSGNQLNFVKYNVADQSINLPFTLQNDTWYHIVAAQGGTSLTYMINGEIVGASNSGVSNNLSIPNGTVNVAKDFYTGTNYAMSLGSLKVYDNCKSSADILSAFEASKTDYGFAGSTPTPTPTSSETPTPTPSATPAATYLNCYTVRQYLYGYNGGGSNGSLFVLESDYPDVSIIPTGATATINGVATSVVSVASSNSAYFQGGNGYSVSFLDNVGSISAGASVELCWYTTTPTPTPTNTSTPTPSVTSTTTPTPTPTPSGTPSASAPMVVTIYNSGSNVVMTSTGTVNLSGLTKVQSNFGPIGAGGLGINTATFISGPNSSYADSYSGFTSVPSNFGSGSGGGNTSGSGDVFGIIVDQNPPYFLLVPTGYTSGANISSTQTFNNTSLSTLGLTNGTYTYTWSGGSVDVVVGGPAPTPTPTPSTGAVGAGWNFYETAGNVLTVPPLSNGQALFYSGAPPLSTYNPNNVGVNANLMFYKNDSAGNSYLTQFQNLVTNGGTISVTQNGHTATYTGTPGAFNYDSGGGFLIFSAGIQDTTVASPFTYGDTITLSFS